MPLSDSDAESGYGEDANTTQEKGPEQNLSLAPEEVTSMTLDTNPGLMTDQQFPALLVIPENDINTPFPAQWPYSSITKAKLYQAALSYVCHFKRPLHMTYLGRRAQVPDLLLAITTAGSNVTTGKIEKCVKSETNDVATANADCQNEEDTTEKRNSEDVNIDVAKECENVDVEDAVTPKSDCCKEDKIQSIGLEYGGVHTNIHESRVELNCKHNPDDSGETHNNAQLVEVVEDDFDTVDRDFDSSMHSPLSTLTFSGSNHSSPREQDLIPDESPLCSDIPKPMHIPPCVSIRNAENMLVNNIDRRSTMLLRDPSTIQFSDVGDVDLKEDSEVIIEKSGDNDNCEAGDMDPPIQAMGSDVPIKVGIPQNTIEGAIAVGSNEFIGNGNLPLELQEDYWDVSLICLDEDEKNARKFAREFEKRCQVKSERPISVRFSCELLCQDLFEQLNVLLERGSIILLYMTYDFIKNRLATYKTHTALYESLTNKGRCGSLIPIFYETPRKNLDIPTELRVLTGTNWEKEPHRDNLVRTCLEKTAVTDENMKELEDKREVARAEIRLRYDEQEKEKQKQLIRIKLERKARLNEQ
ncbi:unnamed protein product [Owenia fusiformis]|uniref:Uncharacterized protein n=1 Tax=Owenia fusiformis TaxID=6347 RepID=A0A8S4PUL2_OWEFU|nr:unnamed protein product [Owenia fusiformis]